MSPSTIPLTLAACLAHSARTRSRLRVLNLAMCLLLAHTVNAHARTVAPFQSPSRTVIVPVVGSIPSIITMVTRPPETATSGSWGRPVPRLAVFVNVHNTPDG
jgi:hypothetical protein